MRWDAGLYDSTGFAQEEAGMRLIELSGIRKSDAILDLGCGTGRFTVALASRAPEGNVMGMDPSMEMLIKAFERAKSFKNITLIRRAAEEMAFNEEFDLVFSNIVLQWIKDQKSVLGLIYRSLKPGGRIALQLPAKAFANEFYAHSDSAIEALGYEEYFRDFKSPWYFPTKADYGMLLGEAGFREIDVSYVDYVLRFSDTEGVLKWLVSGRISPYLERLPEREREDFKRAVAENFARNRTERGIEFVMRRLIALGRKSLGGWTENRKGNKMKNNPEKHKTDQQEIKKKLRETFDTVAEGYDGPALRFFTESAKHLPRYLNLRGDEHVLDVATGTGNAAIALAGALPGGRVTGIDFSEGMLSRARAKIEERSVRNISFLSMDMQALDFPDGIFDAAAFSFCIFFVEDMEALLRHVMGKVKPGGKVLATSFHGGTFSPQVDMFFDRIKKYGVEKPSTWQRLSTEEECVSLFEKAGMGEVRVGIEDIGYHLDDAGQWWDVVWNGGLRRFVSGLSTKDLKKFRAEHLKDVASLSTGKGIWLEVKVLYASGVRQ